MSSRRCFTDCFQLSNGTDFIAYVGVPEEVIQRAAFVLDAIGNDKHVERLCDENISTQDQQYKVLIMGINRRCDHGNLCSCSYINNFFWELNAGCSGQDVGV
jgi:hypothetical protein